MTNRGCCTRVREFWEGGIEPLESLQTLENRTIPGRNKLKNTIKMHRFDAIFDSLYYPSIETIRFAASNKTPRGIDLLV